MKLISQIWLSTSLEGQVHAFVSPVLFGVSGFDALEVDAEP